MVKAKTKSTLRTKLKNETKTKKKKKYKLWQLGKVFYKILEVTIRTLLYTKRKIYKYGRKRKKIHENFLQKNISVNIRCILRTKSYK